jgi:hypothetical protein
MDVALIPVYVQQLGLEGCGLIGFASVLAGAADDLRFWEGFDDGAGDGMQ